MYYIYYIYTYIQVWRRQRSAERLHVWRAKLLALLADAGMGGGHTYICTYAPDILDVGSIHTHTYVYVYICLCVYIYTYVHIHIRRGAAAGASRAPGGRSAATGGRAAARRTV